jgi:hypothetical protein
MTYYFHCWYEIAVRASLLYSFILFAAYYSELYIMLTCIVQSASDQDANKLPSVMSTYRSSEQW